MEDRYWIALFKDGGARALTANSPASMCSILRSQNTSKAQHSIRIGS